MNDERVRRSSEWMRGDATAGSRSPAGGHPGKRTLTESLPPVQAKGDLDGGLANAAVRAVAADGLAGDGQALPHLDRIQGAFGPSVDLSGVRAHVGGAARDSCDEIGARAYAAGGSVAFRDSPDLHTAAHEAAHVVQQRGGVHLKDGLGESGDAWERHADAVADVVVRGGTAEHLFAGMRAGAPSPSPVAAPVQRMKFNDDGEHKWFWGHDTAEVDAFGKFIDGLEQKNSVKILAKILEALEKNGDRDRGEAIAISRVQAALDRLGHGSKSLPGKQSDLGTLDRAHWWKMFIEGNHHKKPDQELFFDKDQSPGYYKALMDTFDSELLPDQQTGGQLGAKDILSMHSKLTSGVLRENDDKSFGKMPDKLSGAETETMYPMLPPKQQPNPEALAEMVKEGTLSLSTNAWAATSGDLAKHGVADRPTQGLSAMGLTKVEQFIVMPMYKQQYAAPLIQRILDAYYDEIAQAQKALDPEHAKLAAICRTIRKLHVGHYFTDANGRLFTMVLLNKLLLAEGFSPVILQDTSTFGGSLTVEELVQQVTGGMKAFEAEAKLHPGAKKARTKQDVDERKVDERKETLDRKDDLRDSREPRLHLGEQPVLDQPLVIQHPPLKDDDHGLFVFKHAGYGRPWWGIFLKPDIPKLKLQAAQPVLSNAWDKHPGLGGFAKSSEGYVNVEFEDEQYARKVVFALSSALA